MSIYNHTTGEWDIPYSESHTQVVYNSSLGKDGPSGGHGYFEDYVPAGTQCANGPTGNPTLADTIETDAQQYSATTQSWTRISYDPDLKSGRSGNSACFNYSGGPPAADPYLSVQTFGDGWSDWEEIADNADYPCTAAGGTCTITQAWEDDGPSCVYGEGISNGYDGKGDFVISPASYGSLSQSNSNGVGTARYTSSTDDPVILTAYGEYESFSFGTRNNCVAHFSSVAINQWYL